MEPAMVTKKGDSKAEVGAQPQNFAPSQKFQINKDKAAGDTTGAGKDKKN